MADWSQRTKESDKAYRRFLQYRDLGPNRSLSKLTTYLVAAEGVRPTYIAQLKVWSSMHDWVARTSAWDQAELERIRAEAEDLREQVRQYALLRSMRAIENITRIGSHLPALPDGGTDKIPTHKGTELKDGGIPIVKPSTALQANIHTLNVAGIVVPKRMKLELPDDGDLRRRRLEAMRSMSREEILALIEGAREAAADGGGEDE